MLKLSPAPPWTSTYKTSLPGHVHAEAVACLLYTSSLSLDIYVRTVRGRPGLSQGYCTVRACRRCRWPGWTMPARPGERHLETSGNGKGTDVRSVRISGIHGLNMCTGTHLNADQQVSVFINNCSHFDEN
jgi:hypothetical protein